MTVDNLSRELLIIAPSAYTLSGLATWLDYLLPGLKSKGWKVTLGLVSGPRHHRPAEYSTIHPFDHTISIHCNCSTSPGRTNAVRKAIQKHDPNIVLTVNIPDAVTATAIERAAGRNVRAVMTCHGIQEDLFADMRHLNRQLDAVVCTNKLACRLAAELASISDNRIFHCAYGTHVEKQLPARPANAVFTIGYSGRLEQSQKRIHDLVEIAQDLRKKGQEFHLLIAGSGPAEDSLRQSFQALNLTDNVTFLGFVAPEELTTKLYWASDALLVTSSWETGPIVIWEAMAVGTPVVTSRYIGSGQERLLWHQQNCLMFDIGDTTTAAADLIALATDPDLANRIRTAAFQTVSEKLSCDVSVDNWNRILRQILETPARTEEVAPETNHQSGRLDRLLGPSVGAVIRKMLMRLPPDHGPGSEWPHTVVGATMNEAEFFERAALLDVRNDEAALNVD